LQLKTAITSIIVLKESCIPAWELQIHGFSELIAVLYGRFSLGGFQTIDFVILL
jgi:hypothetical protein